MAATPALRRYGQRMAGYVMLAAALAASVGLLLGGAGRKDPELTIHRFQAFFRTMDSWMLILMALII